MSRTIRTAYLLQLLLLLGTTGTLHAATANGLMTVSAVILSKSNCLFNTNSTAIPFGSLNPIAPTDVTVTATLTFRCGGSAPDATYLISSDDGLHESGLNAPRMQHGTNAAAYLPYTLSLSKTSGTIPKNIDQSLTLTGTVRGLDYKTAIAGSYADTVTLTISP